MVSCGPKSVGYNTTGVIASNLFGIYTLDEDYAYLLNSKGFTNYSGSVVLKPDMTFQFSKIPCIMCPKIEGGVYSSATGKWRIVKRNAIWALEIYDMDFQTMCCRYALFSFPILGESPPYGIELAFNEDTGLWVKLKKSRIKPESNSHP